jgi:hypothetical protein
VQPLIGGAAGAVGTLALDTATYLDMVVRARPSSGMPGEVAGQLAERANVPLGAEEDARQRQGGLGALLGYATGIGIGLAYGLVRPWLRRAPAPVAGVALGLAAMAGTDVPATVLGVTDPRKWPPSGWLSDLLPHLAYGFATAATFEALANHDHRGGYTAAVRPRRLGRGGWHGARETRGPIRGGWGAHRVGRTDAASRHALDLMD